MLDRYTNFCNNTESIASDHQNACWAHSACAHIHESEQHKASSVGCIMPLELRLVQCGKCQ